MTESTWTIAGQPVPSDAAAAYLVNDYPGLTLLHYDCGGASPRDQITMSDIGRAALFGAFRGWKAVSKTIEAAADAHWPDPPADWKLDSSPDLDPIDWLSTPDVVDARNLFSSLAYNNGGTREAATSKLLHLKWPKFFPVIDGELRDLYADQAMTLQRQMPRNRRRTNATTWAYWMAVRQDLLHEQNTQAARATRQALTDADKHEDLDKVHMLEQLTNLRMLDALAWAVATGDLSAS